MESRDERRRMIDCRKRGKGRRRFGKEDERVAGKEKRILREKRGNFADRDTRAKTPTRSLHLIASSPGHIPSIFHDSSFAFILSPL